MKKIISLLLSLALLCSMPVVLPVAAAPAAGADLFEGTPWTAKQEGDALWLDLGADTLINRIHLSEETYGGVQRFHIEVWNSTDWAEVYRNDYILTERDCILPEDVTTSAVRLVVDELAGDAVITAFSADRQESSGDSAFMNVGYVSADVYEPERNIPEYYRLTGSQYKSLTDIIMAEGFLIDEAGAFRVGLWSGQTDISEVPLAGSEEAAALMRTWIKTLRTVGGNFTDERGARYWFSLTPSVEGFDPAALLDGQTRDALAKSVAAFAAEHDMYGVELNWGHPTTPEGLQAFRLTVTALAAALHEAGLKCAVSLDPAYPTDLTAAEFQAIDYLNCMTYSSVEQTDTVWALMPYAKMTEAADAAIEAGCDRAKIWLGLPDAVATAYQESTLPETDVEFWYDRYMEAAPIIASDGGDLESENVFVLRVPTQEGEQQATILYNGTNLMRDKTAYAAASGFAGVMKAEVR